MSEYGYGHMIAENLSNTERDRQSRADALKDQQRQAELATIGSAGLTPEQQQEAIRTLYQKDPSAFKNHIENLFRRLGGKQPQPTPDAYPGQAHTQAERRGQILSKGKSQEQQQKDLIAARQGAAAPKFGSFDISGAALVAGGVTKDALGGEIDPKQTYRERDSGGQTGYVPSTAKGSNARPVPYYPGAVNLDMAKTLQQQQGLEYEGADGKPYDLTQLPPGAVLIPVYQAGGKNYWTVATDKGRYETADNQRKYEPSVGAPNPAAPSIGLARVPTIGTHQVPGMEPGEKINLTSTSTPVTPGQPQAAPAPQAPPTEKKTAQPKSGGLAPKRTGAAPEPQGGMGTPPPPFAPGTMQSQGKATKPIVAKADAVAANIFGGGDEKPIWDYAWMFDKPELRAALNKALTMNALQIPGTQDDPSFTQQLATVVGLTGASQEQINQAVVQAKEELQRIGGPEAMKMFARMAGMQEDLTALRAVTGGSAAASTIKTMVRAAPVYNVSSTQNFRDMLGATLNTAAKALHAYPEINPAYVQWWEKGAREARGGSTPAPKTNTKPIVQHSPSTGKYRYSTDGGTTWQMGQPPNQ